jgi:hypothetical protein
MAKKRKKLDIRDLAVEYGALNDLDVSPSTPTADRRTLSPTTAIATVVGNYYTPDVLKDKDEFLGVVLASLPSQVPRLSSKSEKFEVFAQTIKKARQSKPLFYTYKVYIPELESRCLEFNEKDTGKSRGHMQPLSMAQRIATMQDTSLDVSLFAASDGIRAIQPGTLVKITFEDLGTMKGPKIISVYKKVFEFTATGTTKSNENKFNEGKTPPAIPNKLEAEGRNEFFWSGGAKIKKCTYIAVDGTKLEVENGRLEGVTDGKGDPIISHVDGASGPKLIRQAHEDWKKLQKAYQARFNKPLAVTGAGYRTYAGQVTQRLRRIKCGSKNAPLNAPVDITSADAPADLKGTTVRAGTKIASGNNQCVEGGAAATPGRSRHGWGISVDLNRSKSYVTGPNGKSWSSTENLSFRWLNKYAVEYNWIFNVRGETWHLSWMRTSPHFKGAQAPGNLTVAARKFDDPENGITADPNNPGFVPKHAPAPPASGPTEPAPVEDETAE